MSVQTQIDRIKANIASAYAKAQEKGAELPAVRNSENLPAVIEAIPAGGLPEGLRTITVTADPPEGGTVSGGGMASDGMTVTVKAEVSGDYKFQEWQDSGGKVSENQDFTFPVSQERSLTAVFKLPFIGTPMQDWWKIPLPISSEYYTLCAGNGKFVIYGTKGEAACSTDGLNWTVVACPVANLSKLVWGDKGFVGIDDNFVGVYSADGLTWEQTTLPNSVSTWSWASLCFGDGKYVINTDSNTTVAAYSADGKTWKTTNTPDYARFMANTYGNGRYVAVPQMGKIALYSSNATSWTKVSLGSSNVLMRSVIYGKNKFVAVGSKYMYSANGSSWTIKDLPSDINDMQDVIFAQDKFIAVCGKTLNYYAESTDGITWTKKFFLDPTHSLYEAYKEVYPEICALDVGCYNIVNSGDVYLGGSTGTNYYMYSGIKEPEVHL